MSLDILKNKLVWVKLKEENLDVDYLESFLPKTLADELLQNFEKEFKYYTGELSTVRVFGKEAQIRRQQVAFGDDGLTYKYSGVCVPSLPWPESIKQLRDTIKEITGHYYNFVLVNRYRNGSDCIGEHRDNEADLDHKVPIVSISFGCTRDFILKSCWKINGKPLKHILKLKHGDLLKMNHPTNVFWKHSVPPRKNIAGVRVSLTFRKIVQRKKNHHKHDKEVTSHYFEETHEKKLNHKRRRNF